MIDFHFAPAASADAEPRSVRACPHPRATAASQTVLTIVPAFTDRKFHLPSESCAVFGGSQTRAPWRTWLMCTHSARRVPVPSDIRFRSTFVVRNLAPGGSTHDSPLSAVYSTASSTSESSRPPRMPSASG